MSSTKYGGYTADDMADITDYVRALNRISDGAVRVDSYSDQFFALDGVPTPFTVRLGDDGKYTLSIAVSL